MSTKQKKKQANGKRKQKLGHFLQKNEEPPTISKQIIDLTPHKLEIIEKFTLWYFIKNINSFQQTQDHEIQLPFLIMNWEEALKEELILSICALANQEQGGFLLIAGKHNGSTIQQGLQNFTQKDEKKIHDLIKRTLKTIVNEKSIQVKVEGMILYPDFQTALKGRKSEQFVIKISICRKSGSKKLFYIQQKLSQQKSIFELPRINIRNQTVFSVQKKTETNIYDRVAVFN